MKNLFSYSDFLNEKSNQINEAKKASPLDLYKKDTKAIIDTMFAYAKKPKYEYNKDGFPTEVEFEIDRKDFIIDYDEDLTNDFSEGVLKKREFVPILKFEEKEEEKEGGKTKYKIKFKIKKDKVEIKKKEEKPRAEQFERDSDEQLLDKLKSSKVKDYHKEKIMDILKGRGVEYKNPFEEEESIASDDEKEKAAEKAAKKNESLDILDEKKEEKCECGTEEKEEEKCECGTEEKEEEKIEEKKEEKCEEEKEEDEEKIEEKKEEKEEDEEKIEEKEEEKCETECTEEKEEEIKEILTFGSEEWNKKYNINIEKEKEEKSLNSLVNETLKSKIDNVESLNEKINNISNNDNGRKPLDTLKK
jgi:hypothetical protein